VRAWLDKQLAETLYLTSITIAELGFGVACLPAGRRRKTLEDALIRTAEVFTGRILDFDMGAATHYARLAAAARQDGKVFPMAGGYIAAIAADRGFIIATCDTSPFEAGGVQTINPWQHG
jgi:hypothetical protein